jgi:hypothetical protein
MMNKQDKDFLRALAEAGTIHSAEELKAASKSAHQERQSIFDDLKDIISKSFKKSSEENGLYARGAAEAVNRHTDEAIERASKLFDPIQHAIALVIAVILGIIAHFGYVWLACNGTTALQVVESGKYNPITDANGNVLAYSASYTANMPLVWAVSIATAILFYILALLVIAIVKGTTAKE